MKGIHRKGLKMLEVDVIDKYLQWFNDGKITGSEFAELILKKVA